MTWASFYLWNYSSLQIKEGITLKYQDFVSFDELMGVSAIINGYKHHKKILSSSLGKHSKLYEVVLIPTKIYLITNVQEIQRVAIHYTTVIQSVKSRLRNCRSMTQFL